MMDFLTDIVGVLNISACQSGAPVFVSQPHFLNGDFYKDTVIGMSPNESIHNTFIDVEPVSCAVSIYEKWNDKGRLIGWMVVLLSLTIEVVRKGTVCSHLHLVCIFDR